MFEVRAIAGTQAAVLVKTVLLVAPKREALVDKPEGVGFKELNCIFPGVKIQRCHKTASLMCIGDI